MSVLLKDAMEALQYLEGWQPKDGADAFEESCATIRQALNSPWQRIDTCPKEKGKPILIVDVEHVIDVGWWNGDFKNHDGYIVEPTHWMPLPAPPNAPSPDQA